MNSREKDSENKAHFKAFPETETKQHSKEAIYYLQRRLRIKDIPYSSREKIVFVTSEETEDKHVQKLLKNYNYAVQTIIK